MRPTHNTPNCLFQSLPHAGRKLAALAGAASLLLAAHSAAAVSTNAWDVASNYTTFAGNQGFGFGPWVLSVSGGGAYISNDGGSHPHSFGLWNNTANAASTANRTFNSPLAVGGTFSCDYLLNSLDSANQSNGFQLQDASGNVLFSYYHQGGDNADGHFIDANGTGVATGFAYNYQRWTTLTFSLDSATTYTFTAFTNGVMEASFSGTLVGGPITQVTFSRANGDLPAPGNGQDFKFDTLIVTGPTGTPPQFVLQPRNQAVFPGSPVSLSAVATSSLGVDSYQWYFQNAPVPGATSTNLSFTNVGSTNAGSYYVVAANSMGPSTSAVAVVTVLPAGFTNAFDVAANYTSFSGNQGYGFGPWVLSTSGGGSYLGNPTRRFYLWNGGAFSQSTATRAFTPPLAVGGTFLVQLQMNSLDFATTQDALELQDADGNVLFSYWHQGGDGPDGHFMDASGGGTATGFAYDYSQFDSFAFILTSATTYTFVDITTGASFSGTLSGAPISQVTFLRVNQADAPTSNGQDFGFDALTTITPSGPPPLFTLQPLSQGGMVGSTLTLKTVVSSTGTTTYQWYSGNGKLSGATTPNLVLSNLALTDANSYWVVAANAFGSATSAVAVVSVYVENSDLLAYEGFDYDAAWIDGATQNGGQGWNGPWVNISSVWNCYVISSNLVGTPNVPPGYDDRSLNSSLYNYGGSRAGRFLDCSTNGAFSKRGYVDANGHVGADGKTLYISFLMQPMTTSSFYECELHRSDLGDPGRIGGIGNDQGSATNVYLRAGGFSDLGPGDLNVNFYVLRLDFQAGNDDVRVYRNPTSVTEPATASLTNLAAADMSFDGISIGAWGNAVGVDEIRVGATWEDVMGLAVSNLLPPAKTVQGWRVQFAATPGFTYHVERAPSVSGPWTDLATVAAPDTGLCDFVDTAPLSGQAFYRTVRR